MLDESFALISSIVTVNRPVPLKMSVSSAKKQKISRRHEMVHVMAAGDGAPFGIVPQQLDIEPVQPAGGPDVEGAFADLFDGCDAGERQEKAEMVREVGIGAGDRLAARQILGLELVAVGRQMNFALALAVAGLAFSAARVFVTSPVKQTAIWMLLV